LKDESRKEKTMKKYFALLLLAGMTQWGCEFVGGAAAGALATGAGYEINANRQMDRSFTKMLRGSIS
jgi:hypothetical protein